MNNEIHKEQYHETKDNTKLFYCADIPLNPRAIVIIVHGVCEHCGRYDYLEEALFHEGVGVYRFDLRGHGKSGGERGYTSNFLNYAKDVDELVALIKNDYPTLPIIMLGHSMGAFISVTYEISFPGRIKFQILSGLPAIRLPLPTIKILKFLPYDQLPMIRLGNDLGKVVSRDPSVVKSYIEDPLNLKKATIKMSGEMFIKGTKWLSEHVHEYRLPCLLLHGESDLIVTPSASLWFFDKISSVDKKRITYPELYHEIFNEKEKDTVIKDSIDWINRHI